MIQKEKWENFFNANQATEWYPSEPVVRLLCNYRKKFGSKDVKVLDLGCGNGRHVVLASREGFSVYGIDLAEKAIKIAKEWLALEYLSCEDLRSGNVVEPLPYDSNFFDIVISYGVLDHIVLSDAQKVLAEARRVLKPGGLVFLKLESNTSFTFDPLKQVAKNEVILDKAVESGMIQHFFDREEAGEFVKNFEVVQFFRDDYRRFDDLEKNYQSRWIFIGKKL